MQDIRQIFTDIKEQVENKVYDSYLLEYIETPVIDEDKLLILISIMEQLELSFSRIHNYSLSTMLIQIALDTHEHIFHAAKDEKNRQLTVLAGDYFSGLYYKFLAETEDISLIKALSLGVKEVNENKILVYRSEIDGIDQLMNCLKRIESSILTKLSTYFKVELWNDFVSHLFLFKRLINEKQQYFYSKSSVLFDILKNLLFAESESSDQELRVEQERQLIQICDDYLERSKQVIELGLERLPFLNDLVKKRVSSLLSQEPYAKTFVEEG